MADVAPLFDSLTLDGGSVGSANALPPLILGQGDVASTDTLQSLLLNNIDVGTQAVSILPLPPNNIDSSWYAVEVFSPELINFNSLQTGLSIFGTYNIIPKTTSVTYIS